MTHICYDSIHIVQPPLDTAELLAFATTVDARSLSRAAATLRVPRATIGRRLARLEKRLGVRLLRRTTRSLALTDAGEALYRHARLVLDAVAEAEASVAQRGDALRGNLRVAIPPGLPASFRAVVCDFAQRHPEVRLQVYASTEQVDLRRDGYDVAVRASAEHDPGLIARRIFAHRFIAVASPAYLAEHGTPQTPRDLARHRALMGFARGELPATHWPTPKGGKVQVPGRLYVNDVFLLLEAARRGLGIALLSESVVGADLAAGRLRRVLSGTVEGALQFAIVYPERELVPPQVRAFVEVVAEWGKREFGPR